MGRSRRWWREERRETRRWVRRVETVSGFNDRRERRGRWFWEMAGLGWVFDVGFRVYERGKKEERMGEFRLDI